MTLAALSGPVEAAPWPQDGMIVNWGWRIIPTGTWGGRAIAAGVTFNLAHGYFIPPDGLAYPRGPVLYDEFRPLDLTDVVDMAIGEFFAVALRGDGTVVTWGRMEGTMEGPPGPRPEIVVPEGLNNLVAVAATDRLAAALRADGRVLTWGDEWSLRVAEAPEIDDALAIAGCGGAFLALRRDGSVAAWGPFATPGYRHVMSLQRNVTAIAQGISHALLLRNDGTVLHISQAHPEGERVEGIANATAVAAGRHSSLILKADGTVTGWGSDGSPPSGLKEVVAIYAGGHSSFAWTLAPFIAYLPPHTHLEPGMELQIEVEAVARGVPSYQWLHDGVPIPGGTGPRLIVPAVEEADAGFYRVVVSHAGYSATSEAVGVAIGRPLILSGPDDLTVVESSKATLLVRQLSRDWPTFQWYRGDDPIPGANWPWLEFPEVSRSDEGEYRVEVANDYGVTESRRARLTVLADTGPRLDQTQPQSCSAADLRPGPGLRELAQTFTPSFSGRFHHVLFSGNAGSPAQEWPTLVELRETVDGRPEGPLLGSVAVPALNTGVEAHFADQAIHLEAGRRYALVFSTEAPESMNASQYTIRTCFFDLYPGGDLWIRWPGGSWTIPDLKPDGTGSTDLAFSTYMIPGLPPVRLDEPRPGTLIRAGDTIRLRAVPDPAGEPVSEMTFFANGVPVGTVVEPPFEIAWQPLEPGSVELAVEAVLGGTLHRSEPVVIQVRLDGPPNDDFARRTILEGDAPRAATDFTRASTEPDDPRPFPETQGRTLWWEWTAGRTGHVTVGVPEPDGPGIALAVLDGTSPASGTLTCTGLGSCEFHATQGRIYLIVADVLVEPPSPTTLHLASADLAFRAVPNPRGPDASESYRFVLDRIHQARVLSEAHLLRDGVPVASMSGDHLEYAWDIPLEEPGTFVWQVRATDAGGFAATSAPLPMSVRPANDDHQRAIELGGTQARVIGSNVAATREAIDYRMGSEGLWGTNEGGRSIWYRWTAPASGLIELTASGTHHPNGPSFHALLAGFLGDSPSLDTYVGKVVISIWSPVFRWRVEEGATYLFLVDGAFGEEGRIAFDLALRPVNDSFADRARIEGAAVRTRGSLQGATLETGEVALFGTSDAVSAWWTWTAPADGPVEVSAVSQTAPAPSLTVRLFSGSQLGSLTAIPDLTLPGTPRPTTTFLAQRDQTYHIAVLGPRDATDAFLLSLDHLGIRLVVPADGAVFRAPAEVPLEAGLPDPQTRPLAIFYFANGMEIGRVLEAPYILPWHPAEPGAYQLEVEAHMPSGVTLRSPSVAVTVFEGTDLPRPRVFAGPAAQGSYLLNAAGMLQVSGLFQQHFGLGPSQNSVFARTAQWPPEVRRWTTIVGGASDLAQWIVPGQWFPVPIPDLNPHRGSSWAIAENGVLYRNGETAIPFPPNVRAWRKLGMLHRVLYALGDDGVLYEDGRDRHDFAARLEWSDFVLGYFGRTTTLTPDGRAFHHLIDPWDLTTDRSYECPFPEGVRRWLAVDGSGSQVILWGDDGELYLGLTLNQDRALDVPTRLVRPDGVTGWHSVAAGGEHALALTTDGRLFGWGRNFEGQLGVGTSTHFISAPTPVSLPPSVHGWIAVAAGQNHTLAVGDDCHLYAWGSNSHGQLGLGWITHTIAPARVANVGSLCGIPVVFTTGETFRLDDGRFRFRFPTDFNRPYTIQYTDPTTAWRPVFPPIVGTGATMEWIDDGPPATVTHPRDVPWRFYRLVFGL